MTSLRDRVRDALKEGDLTPQEASADFARVAGRTGRRRRIAWWPAAAALTALAAGGLYVVATRAPEAPQSATEIYIRVQGEPAEGALSLTIVTRSAQRTALVLDTEGNHP